MAGVTAQGGTFTFTVAGSGPVSATIVGLSVESPTAEVVDMTPVTYPAGGTLLVPSGHVTGGSVTVDYIHSNTGTDPHSLIKSVGTLSFASAGLTVTKQAVLESATAAARVGDIVQGTLKFRLTDYYE